MPPHPVDMVAALRYKLHESLQALAAAEQSLHGLAASRERAAVQAEFASASLAAAQASYNAAQGECVRLGDHYTQMEAQYNALVALVQWHRKQLGTMVTLPDDILSMIFEEVCSTPSPSTSCTAHVERDHTLAAYTLATVCTRWRNVALHTQRLWRRITVTNQAVSATDIEPFMQHIDTLISRAGSTALDVSIICHAPNSPAAWKLHDSFFSAFFSKLYPVVSKIRYLEVSRSFLHPDGSEDTLKDELLTLLRCPTPRLEELSIHMPTLDPDALFTADHWLGYPEKDLPRFLPDARALRHMSIKHAPIICCKPHSPLPALISLQLAHFVGYAEHIWDMLSLSPNLRDLHISMLKVHSNSGRPIMHLESLPVQSLNLGELCLADLSYGTTQVEMPNLRTLQLEDHALVDLVITDALARSVTTIVVTFDESDRDAAYDKLRALSSVERATVAYDEALPADEGLLFAALCKPNNPMWPALRSLTIKGLDSSDDVERDGVLRLLQIRNGNRNAGADAQGRARTVPIEELAFDEDSVPRWVTVQAQAILGDNCKQL